MSGPGEPQRAASPAPAVTMRIGEMVLHGFPALDRHRVAGAFRQELARLLAAEGVPRAWEAAPRAYGLDAGRIELQPEIGPEALGERLAQAVFGQARDPRG